LVACPLRIGFGRALAFTFAAAGCPQQATRIPPLAARLTRNATNSAHPPAGQRPRIKRLAASAYDAN